MDGWAAPPDHVREEAEAAARQEVVEAPGRGFGGRDRHEQQLAEQCLCGAAHPKLDSERIDGAVHTHRVLDRHGDITVMRIPLAQRPALRPR